MIGALDITMMVLGMLNRYAPLVLNTIEDVKPFATAVYGEIKGSAPTEQEQAELEASIDRLYARSQEPLPPPQIGDPDYRK